MDDEATERNTLSVRAACWFKKNCPLEMRVLLRNVHLIRWFPNFLRVTLTPSGEHESICACTVWCNLKHICRFLEVFLPARLLGLCLTHWIDDAMVTVDFHMLF